MTAKFAKVTSKESLGRFRKLQAENKNLKEVKCYFDFDTDTLYIVPVDEWATADDYLLSFGEEGYGYIF